MRNTTWLIYQCPGNGHDRIGVAIPNSDDPDLSSAYHMLLNVMVNGLPERSGGWWYCETTQ